MSRLLRRVFGDDIGPWQFALGETNTGRNARRQLDGNFAENPNAPGSRELADQVNFGTFPGQYSTGFAAKGKIVKKTSLTAIRWKDWEPAFRLQDHRLPNGDMPPDTMELFDKNFNDQEVEIDGHQVHMVTFHTVPAFNFGGTGTLNIERNRAQLEFLEWYLTGSCVSDGGLVRSCQAGVRPLAENAAFIAVGDFNVDYRSTNSGAAVMQRLLQHARIHNFRSQHLDQMFQADPGDGKSYVTYMSDGIDLGKLQSNLDYFLVSKNIKVISDRVIAPLSDYAEHKCLNSKSAAQAALAQLGNLGDEKVASVSTRYQDDGSRTYCVISVAKEFAKFRAGSDHFPVLLTFSM
jgi:hypothetical protein